VVVQAGDYSSYRVAEYADFQGQSATLARRPVTLTPCQPASRISRASAHTLRVKDIWIADIAKYGGCGVVFPINADAALQVATAFDLLPAGVYLPDGRSAADSATARSRSSSAGPQTETSMTCPMSVGRNFAGILRIPDALQNTARMMW
jgi:alkyl hydroperoxide reductase subunit AhpC